MDKSLGSLITYTNFKNQGTVLYFSFDLTSNFSSESRQTYLRPENVAPCFDIV